MRGDVSMRRVCTLISALVIVGFLSVFSRADEVEYDVCSCKQVQIGAQSTLRRGVCQRTEAGSCLMQWGALSQQKVPTGNGQSQQEAAVKAEDLLRRGSGGDFKITQYTVAGGGFPLISPRCKLQSRILF